jgi:hypothetical protein
MVSSGMLRRVTLVRADVSEEPVASFIRVTRIGELFLRSVRRLLVAACVVPSSPKRRFLQEPHGVTSKNRLTVEFGRIIAVLVTVFSACTSDLYLHNIPNGPL